EGDDVPGQTGEPDRLEGLEDLFFRQLRRRGHIFSASENIRECRGRGRLFCRRRSHAISRRSSRAASWRNSATEFLIRAVKSARARAEDSAAIGSPTQRMTWPAAVFQAPRGNIWRVPPMPSGRIGNPVFSASRAAPFLKGESSPVRVRVSSGKTTSD